MQEEQKRKLNEQSSPTSSTSSHMPLNEEEGIGEEFPFVRLVWITPEAEKIVLECARVSSEDQNSGKVGLIKYLIDNHHWSPFEMSSACFEIVTTRAISRQIIRHRSFSFQEFSQRYQKVDVLTDAPVISEARHQDKKNRQNSIPLEKGKEDQLKSDWEYAQHQTWDLAKNHYKSFLERGLAKEVARSLLPEGLTQTKLYMSGNIRSWMHYCDLRSSHGTQLEHSLVARKIRDILITHLPHISKAMKW